MYINTVQDPTVEFVLPKMSTAIRLNKSEKRSYSNYQQSFKFIGRDISESYLRHDR